MDTYEKKYNEALERAKEWITEREQVICPREIVESIFPQLRESEDERMMKVIALALTDVPEERFTSLGITLKDCLAYLEKQKDAFENGRQLGIMQEQARQELEWDEQKEQKPINNSTREKIINRATSEKQVVLISESSGNAEIGWDTRSLEDAKNLLEYGISFINKQLGVKPAEWSKEDEKELDCIINILDRLGFEEFCKSSRDQDIEEERFYYKEIQFLKRLKSLRPQPHWKPSEEQIYSLGTVVKGAGENSVGSIAYNLKELYEQLKKL